MRTALFFISAFMLTGTLRIEGADAPNVILLLADDQGWTGSSVVMDERVPNSVSDLYQTPNLERLAAQGMRFSNGYSPAPNCSPTRMSIQTGKTSTRLGASDIIDVVPDKETGRAVYQFFYDQNYVNKPLLVHLPISDLPDEETTIAEFLKQHDSDYATAHFGKWHMGGGSPERHGYDAHSGLTSNREGLVGGTDPKRTGEITRQSLQFLKEQADRGGPFFMQVSWYAVHTPIRAKEETIEKYSKAAGGVHFNRTYAAMTEELDQSVGAILDQVEELGLGDNTYVIYTSDNGGELNRSVTTNVPLAKGKTHVWEGGVRVPLIVRGPGIEAGSQSDVPAIGYDFLPTIASWIGATDKLPGTLDGGSLDPVLKNGGQGKVERGTNALIWYYGAYRTGKHVAPQAAIRRGPHKLIWEFESDRTILYDLGLDLSETTDLSRFRPEVAKSLHAELRDYFQSVGAKLPTVNPNYDPNKDPGLTANIGNRRGGNRGAGNRGAGNRRQPATQNRRRPSGTRPPTEQ